SSRIRRLFSAERSETKLNAGSRRSTLRLSRSFRSHASTSRSGAELQDSKGLSTKLHDREAPNPRLLTSTTRRRVTLYRLESSSPGTRTSRTLVGAAVSHASYHRSGTRKVTKCTSRGSVATWRSSSDFPLANNPAKVSATRYPADRKSA